MRNCLSALLAFLIITIAAFDTAGQTPAGTIEGTIVDPQSAVVAGAVVRVTEAATGKVTSVVTNASGFYTVRSLPLGQYSVRIEKDGFSAVVVESVIVQVGLIARADVQLKVGAVGETVTVDVGSTELQVDTVRQTVDGVITARQITALPLNERNFLDLAVLQPGVTVVDGGTNDPTKVNGFRAVRVNGGSGTGTRVQIEGIDVTDEVVGMSVANISTDAVQEFNLARSSFDLSTSLTSSGAVSIASRTGGNKLTGSGFYFGQDDRFDARPGFASEKPEFNRDQYGYRVGGPILKNRLFFFSNAERFDQQDFADFTSTNFPSFNTNSTLPIENFNSLQRLDFDANSTTRLFYLFNHSDDTSTGGSLRSPFQNVNWTNLHVAGANLSTAGFTHSIRFGYVNFNNNIASAEITGFEFPRAPSGTPIQLNVGDLSVGPNSLAPQQTYQDNHQFKYDGSTAVGSHVLRFGGDITRILLGGFANFSGPMSFFGDRTNCSDPSDPFSCLLTDFAIGPNNGFFTARPAHGFDFGGKLNYRYSWYIGDQWKLRRNLTVSLGLRHNYDSNFFSSNDVPFLADVEIYGPGIGSPAKYPKTAFSPQVGFAWDPFGNGKTSIRGGFYIAYEGNIFNNSLFDEFARIQTGIGPSQFFSDHVFGPDGSNIVINGIPGCDPADVADGNYTCLLGRPISEVTPFVEQINAGLQAAYGSFQQSFDPNAPPSEFSAFQGVTFGGQFPGDYNLPYSMQFNIGLQRELSPGHVLSVDYVRQRGVGLPLQLDDREARRDSRFFNEAAARASIANRIGVAPADVSPTTIQNFLNANPSASITTFALANDTIWPGQSAQNLRARLVVGGFSLYQGLQISLNGRFGEGKLDFLSLGSNKRLLTGLSYTLGYALASNKSTSGGGRPEFIANVINNRDFNSAFGPNSLDRTHNLTISTSMSLIGGFQLDSIFRLSTAPPLTVTVPNFRGTSGIFTSDFNGDGGIGTLPRADILPGTNVGDFGRRISSLENLNQAISQYNQAFAGTITPHGRRLVEAGIFSEAQLVAIGAVMPTIAPIPANNPNPFESRFNADMRLSRPIRLGRERFQLEPSFSVFNVFNNNSLGTFGGGALSGAFGSLNFNYSNPDDRASLSEARGNVFRRRQLQFGIRFSF